MGSRAIYHDGWMASAFGPRIPWVPGLPPGIREWTPDKDQWELYNLEEDWSQANDLAAEMPEKLAELKELFLIEAARNKALPIGGGLWMSCPASGTAHRPALQGVDLLGQYHADAGVLRAGAGQQDQSRHHRRRDSRPTPTACSTRSAGSPAASPATCKDGMLCYEYNLFMIQRTQIAPREKLPDRQGQDRGRDRLCGAKARPARWT